MSEPQRAFVTGGTGFIGSHLVEDLIDDDLEVRCLIRSRPKWLEGLDVVPVAGSLHDPAALEKGIRNADLVYHLAGATRAPDAETFRRHNVEAVQNLLDVCARRADPPERIVLVSSLAAVGRGARGAAGEIDPLRPVSQYGASKAEMERTAWSYRELPITIVRPPAVYGPRDRDVLKFLQWMDRGLLPVVGPIDEPRVSLIHVRDLVRGIRVAARTDRAAGETYFLGSERPYSWAEIRDAATPALGREARLVRVPGLLVQAAGAVTELWGHLTGTHPPFNRDKARELRKACTACTIDKARRELGFAPEVPLEEGLAATIRWYRDRGWIADGGE